MGCPLCQVAMLNELTLTTRPVTMCSRRSRSCEIVEEAASGRTQPAYFIGGHLLRWRCRSLCNGRTPHTPHARCKHQALRHNLEEIQQWPPANCHYVHDPQEWTPNTSSGKRVYPSKEEVEYTAVLAFAIAVSASCQKGPGHFASAGDAGVHRSGAPRALTRHGPSGYEGMGHGTVGSDPWFDGRAAG